MCSCPCWINVDKTLCGVCWRRVRMLTDKIVQFPVFDYVILLFILASSICLVSVLRYSYRAKPFVLGQLICKHQFILVVSRPVRQRVATVTAIVPVTLCLVLVFRWHLPDWPARAQLCAQCARHYFHGRLCHWNDSQDCFSGSAHVLLDVLELTRFLCRHGDVKLLIMQRYISSYCSNNAQEIRM